MLDKRKKGLIAEGDPRVLRDFFFSSRRRHTRLTCDWSSDVCSSDLASPPSAKTSRARDRPCAPRAGRPNPRRLRERREPLPPSRHGAAQRASPPPCPPRRPGNEKRETGNVPCGSVPTFPVSPFPFPAFSDNAIPESTSTPPTSAVGGGTS